MGFLLFKLQVSLSSYRAIMSIERCLIYTFTLCAWMKCYVSSPYALSPYALDIFTNSMTQQLTWNIKTITYVSLVWKCSLQFGRFEPSDMCCGNCSRTGCTNGRMYNTPRLYNHTALALFQSIDNSFYCTTG